MKRLEFGALVALLRNELGWTQSQLAEYAEIEIATLSNIERGAKKFFEPELLFRLANALQLTSLERREFFLASCGLDQKQIVRQPSTITPTNVFDSKNLLHKLTNLVSQIYAPAILGDVFGDILAVNNILLEVLNIDPSLAKMLAQNGVRINYLQIVFDVQGVFSENGVEFDISLLRAFREGSLRYRTKQRYTEVLQGLRNIKEYPSFDRYWRRVSTIEDDKESMLDPINIKHNTYGNLQFTISSSVTLTPHGELFLSHYFPMDLHTAESVIEIAKKVGTEVIPLSSWPQKD